MQKKYRLTNSRSFEFIYKKGTAVRNKSLVLIYLTSKFSAIKVGFSVSKKVGGSVVRNKLKRRLKETFRLHIPQVTNGYSYIVVARCGSNELTYAELAQSLLDLLKTAGKLKEA